MELTASPRKKQPYRKTFNQEKTFEPLKSRHDNWKFVTYRVYDASCLEPKKQEDNSEKQPNEMISQGGVDRRLLVDDVFFMRDNKLK